MMSDIIRLLPDSVANQIAAGEVIQRPASALKELLENAIDAGATEIKISVKDSGKTLIQVIDNGCGMSEADAGLCFERHATSKIQEANDLFAIQTLGFRGEALASIAAIAQVELRTGRVGDELGSVIVIEGSKIKSQSPLNCLDGTSVSVKNLFFNVPARRNFLKSNSAELRHIIEEFHRSALVHNKISFSLQHNDKQLFKLNKCTLLERIIALYGNMYRERLIPLEQKANEITISGYIGKPEYAKKTRGEQYFFANKRFIKHAYLNHSVANALQELLPKDTFPTYFIYIEVDPKDIDVNIHPTKTEVNFLNNQLLYALLRTTIKQSLGKHSITPTIDFDVEQSLDLGPPKKGQPIKNPFHREHSEYNPFDVKSPGRHTQKPTGRQMTNKEHWKKLYEGHSKELTDLKSQVQPELSILPTEYSSDKDKKIIFQFNNQFILSKVKSGILLIDQHRAHERILYERYLEYLNTRKSVSQQELFPQNVSFSTSDAEIIKEIKDDLQILGFEINQLGKNTFIINGTPSEIQDGNLQQLMENVLENYKKNLVDLNLNNKINIARSMAANMAVRHGKPLKEEEMEKLIDELFACSVTEVSPGGHKIISIITIDQIEKMFK
jgi:DNA mismatch repair protein MutL